MPLQAPETNYRLKNLKTVVSNLLSEDSSLSSDKKGFVSLVKEHYENIGQGKKVSLSLNEMALIKKAVEDALDKK